MTHGTEVTVSIVYSGSQTGRNAGNNYLWPPLRTIASANTIVLWRHNS